jgi:hypothetical protein
MASKMIELKAKANLLKIEGYRTMSEDQLIAAIAAAEKKPAAKKAAPVKAAPTKAAPVAKVSPAKAAGKTTPTKATPSKSTPAKSAPQKSAPTKATAAKGTAKRSTAGSTTKAAPKPAAKTTAKPAVKATPKQTGNKLAASATKNAAAKKATLKANGTPGVRKTTTGKVIPKARIVKTQGTRNTIDRSAIDWTIDAGIGSRGGKRADVMKALKRFKGNYDKCFEALLDRAAEFYPSKPKGDKRDLATYQASMLRWLINRVALDYVLITGQHVPGSRVAYGTRVKPEPKEAPAKAAARKPAVKASPVRKVAASVPARKPAAARTAPRKATPAVAKGKPAQRGATKGK